MIIKNISKKQFAFLILGIFALCLFVNNFNISDHLYLHNGFSVIWFLMLYLIAGGTKKFDLFNIKNWVLILVYFGSLILLICQKIFPSFAEIEVVKYIFNLRSTYDSAFALACSVSLLALFARIKQPENKKLNKFICLLASTGFGVYLLHDNNLVRGKIYGDWFKVQRFYTDKFSSLHLLFFALSTFIICVLIDLLRQGLDKIIRKLIAFLKEKREQKKKINNLS